MFGYDTSKLVIKIHVNFVELEVYLLAFNSLILMNVITICLALICYSH